MKTIKAVVASLRGWGYLIAFVTGGNFIRRSRLTLGRNVKISPTAMFKFPEYIQIGDNSFVNHQCSIWASPGGRITIGANVLMGPCTSIISSNHGFKAGALIREQPGNDEPIFVGNDVWLGANVVVTGGVTIGNGCVVGAGAVVTKDLPDMSISVGVPARPISFRSPDSASLSKSTHAASRP